jgi:hypothetical protein
VCRVQQAFSMAVNGVWQIFCESGSQLKSEEPGLLKQVTNLWFPTSELLLCSNGCMWTCEKKAVTAISLSPPFFLTLFHSSDGKGIESWFLLSSCYAIRFWELRLLVDNGRWGFQ